MRSSTLGSGRVRSGDQARPGRRDRFRSPMECSGTGHRGDIFGLTQNAGMGWKARRGCSRSILDSEHAGRPARAPSLTSRSRHGLSYGALGDRHSGAGGSRGINKRAGVVRGAGMVSDPCDERGHPGDSRDDGQSALPQRCGHRLPAARCRPRSRCREGSWGLLPATRDFRPLMMALAGFKSILPACWCPAV